MICEVEIDGEKVLAVDSVEEFEEAASRGMAIIAPEAIRREFGTPEEIRDAQKDTYNPGLG